MFQLSQQVHCQIQLPNSTSRTTYIN